LLYCGTLATRNPVSANSLDALVEHAAIPLFVDINLRPPWWDHAIIEHVTARANWLKLNTDELGLLSNGQSDVSTAGALREAKQLDWVILTAGAEGASMVTANDIYPGMPVPVESLEDTVGAGDAFSAVTLLGILQGWPVPLILQRALTFAARICEQRGATKPDRELYAYYCDQWQT
jgi:fructokinase